jgi:hypothetical protein
MKKIGLFTIILFPLVSLCQTANPLTQESREVEITNDPDKTVTVFEGMVWYNSRRPTHGLRMPAGTYVLEAEDKNYLYFRSEAPLEMRTFKNGKVVDGRNLKGGVMLNEKWLSRIPAACYIDEGESSKLMIWKLGKSFIRREGKDWEKNFK